MTVHRSKYICLPKTTVMTEILVIPHKHPTGLALTMLAKNCMQSGSVFRYSASDFDAERRGVCLCVFIQFTYKTKDESRFKYLTN